MLQDEIIDCKVCGAEFIFSVGEQQFFKEKNLLNRPQKCSNCRLASRMLHTGRLEEINEAICDDCNTRILVPFRPTGSKPIYCYGCIGARRAAVEKFGNSPISTPISENQKMTKMTQMTVPEFVPTPEQISNCNCKFARDVWLVTGLLNEVVHKLFMKTGSPDRVIQEYPYSPRVVECVSEILRSRGWLVLTLESDKSLHTGLGVAMKIIVGFPDDEELRVKIEEESDAAGTAACHEDVE